MKRTVVELFAGVGGFRVGLNKVENFDKDGRAIEKGSWEFVWANQWEPSTKTQDAFECYNLRFRSEHNTNEDISKINKQEIPTHTLLVGGFPCQDYSVAHTLAKAKGIEGKKGVLWWQINQILEVKKPPFILLENVDRLVKSPAKQRGRDFGIMMRCLSQHGYAMEWRVINAADYGFPQKRKRIFIFAYQKNTKYYEQQKFKTPLDIVLKEGVFAKAFPAEVKEKEMKEYSLFKGYKDLVDVSERFTADFEASGYMIDETVYTIKTEPVKISPTALGEILEQEGVETKYFLNKEEKEKYEYLRGAKKILRKDAKGFEYFYTEGAMKPSDDLTFPARTMLTSEGTINRSTHIVLDKNKKRLRHLTPVECERINQFPDNWTNTGMTERKRYFMMGNALVCGVVGKIGEQLGEIIDNEEMEEKQEK